MLRRRISGVPIAPSEPVKDSILYVQAPWHKDLSPYNREIYQDNFFIDTKIDGIYGFSPRNGYIYGGMSFYNNDNIQPDNTMNHAIESLFYISTKDIEPNTSYYIFMGGYGNSLCNFKLGISKDSSSNNVVPFDFISRQSIYLPINQWVHYMGSWQGTHGKIFVDGQLVYEYMYDRLYMGKLPLPATYNIGGSQTIEYGARIIPGYIGYVKIWNYAKNFDLDKFVPDT